MAPYSANASQGAEYVNHSRGSITSNGPNVKISTGSPNLARPGPLVHQAEAGRAGRVRRHGCLFEGEVLRMDQGATAFITEPSAARRECSCSPDRNSRLYPPKSHVSRN